MATTFVDYEKDKGFWIAEGFMEVICNQICDVMEKKGLDNRPGWYIEVYEDFLFKSKGYARTWMAFAFELDLQNIFEREQELIAILQETKNAFELYGEAISAESLTAIKNKRQSGDDDVARFTKAVKTSGFIETLNAIIKLFNHEWNEKDYNMEFKILE